VLAANVAVLVAGCVGPRLPWPVGGVPYTQSELDSSIAQCTDIISKTPQNSDAYRCRGECYSRKGEKEKALADLIKAADLAPSNPKALGSLAREYHVQKKYVDAHRAAVRVAKLPNANQEVVGMFLNANIHAMAIEDELELKKENLLTRYLDGPTAEITALKQWQTVEQLQRLLLDRQLAEVPQCWSKGKYRDYITKCVKEDPDGFIKQYSLTTPEMETAKRKFLNGQPSVFIFFVKQDGEWKIDQL
jgi:tetratricopeptide (TPR) repeat protein